MNGHINGWAVISRHLLLREKNQSDLARLLHISPAAITQIKNGQFRLNPLQLHAIPTYLEFNQAACDEFFSEIFNARMQFCHGERVINAEHINCTVKVERKNCSRKIPVGHISILKNFIPALESLADFLRRHTLDRYACSCRNGSVALEVDDEVTGGKGSSLLIVSGDSYPVPGEPAIAAWDDGTFAMGTFNSDSRERHIAPFCSTTDKKNRKTESLRWIYPIIRQEAVNS
ncbi:MAG: helix-turn-helix transcriptional regulator [Lentisphaerae bacterium]|nr:helix-turn-helix transcriptional regulator [Lentisphaerota bacterium]